ncbi:MAG: MFS transporter [Sphingomonadaceae bacterium]|nr:MFS transporter [Sphingomonadaceae bacterium]
MATAALEIGPASGTFFGHPRGLAYLAFTEMWERFSFYGMRALLGLYMVQELLLPGHVENVAGMVSLKAVLEGAFGPLSPIALSSQIFGFYAGLVYFTAPLGGYVADRWLGAKRTVLIGVVLMTIGHMAMVFEASFLLALLLLILGSGCLKGNIAAQVGHLYPPGDKSRASQGYAIFSTGINIGAAAGPLACGLIAQIYGWHAGFATAGILMLLACAVYLAGQKDLPEERADGAARAAHPPLTREEKRRVWLVTAVMAITFFPQMAYDQFLNTGLLWVSGHVDMATPIGPVPVAWFASFDSIVSILITPSLIAMWARMARRRSEPNDIVKIGIGATLQLASGGLLIAAALLAGDGRTGVWLPMLGFASTGIAFMWYWPVLLAFVSRHAPGQLGARLMALAYLVIFGSNVCGGLVGSLYEWMGPATFWIVNTAISACGAFAAFLFGPAITRALADSELPTGGSA